MLLISQVYPPDPAAVGQYLADAAGALAARGWKLTVLTADRGYDDPAIRFSRREEVGGIAIRRLRWSSFGKRSILVRLGGMALFLGQAAVRGLAAKNLTAVLVSTSPPMAGAVAWLVAVLRGVPLVYWAMDLNPDQAVAGGRARPGSLPVRIFDWANSRVLGRADSCIVLDRFMARRIEAKGVPLRRLAVIPPWPLEILSAPARPGENPFRRRHGLAGKFVVMYSGNHSWVHPLDTLLAAARRLRDDPRFVFVLIGGGVAKAPFEEARRSGESTNLLLLPYQPVADLGDSLAAADVHIVAMGDAMVGCVHPCKFYGALAVSRPVILIGPAECHVTDVFARADCGWRIAHGDAGGLTELLRRLGRPESAEELRRKALAGRAALDRGLGRAELRERWADEVETAIGAAA